MSKRSIDTAPSCCIIATVACSCSMRRFAMLAESNIAEGVGGWAAAGGGGVGGWPAGGWAAGGWAAGGV